MQLLTVRHLAVVLATTALSTVAPTVAQAQDWTGPFVGAKAGFGSLSSNTDSFGSPASENADLSGMLFGIQAGYNMQLDNNLVLGIAGDWMLSTMDGNGDRCSVGCYFNVELNSLGSAQVRAGMALGEANNTLLFVGAGLAAGDATISGYFNKASKTHLGFIVSGGVAHKLNEAVSIEASVSYVDLGKESYNAGETVKLNGVTGAVGINFHF